MAIQNKDYLRGKFKFENVPEQVDFHDLVDSMAPIEGSSNGDFNSSNLLVKGDMQLQGEAIFEPAFSAVYLGLNKDESEAGVSAGEAGIFVGRGVFGDYKIVFRDTDDTFVAGFEGAVRTVATVDNPQHQGLALWNDDSGRMDFLNTLRFRANTLYVSGDMTVSADVSVSGVSSLDVATLEIEDNTILLNSGESPGNAGVSADTAGLSIYRGSASAYQLLFREADDSFVAGEAGSEQALASRQESPLDNALALWNASEQHFETQSALTFSAARLTVTGDIRLDGKLDGVDIAANGSKLDMLSSIDSGIGPSALDQLQNIDANLITNEQWGYLGSLNQGLDSGASPQFGNITVSGTVAGLDLALQNDDLNTLYSDSELDLAALTTEQVSQLSNIDGHTIGKDQWAYLSVLDQDVRSNADPTFASIGLSGSLDGRDIVSDGNALDTLTGFGFSALNLAEFTQLKNMGTLLLPPSQWLYLSNFDQDVNSSADVTFANINISGNINTRDLSADGLILDSLVGVPQLQNIGSTTITPAQWSYLGNLDQALNSGADVKFNDINVSGTVDTVDVVSQGEDINNLHTTLGWGDLSESDVDQLKNIGTETLDNVHWGYLSNFTQALHSGADPSFVNVNATTISSAGFSDDSVSLENLSTGISPAYIVVAAGTVEFPNDNLATRSFNIEGFDLLNTDIPLLQIGRTNNGNDGDIDGGADNIDKHIKSAYINGSDELVVVLDSNNDGGITDINYVIHRQAS